MTCSELTEEQRSDLRTVCVTKKGAKFKRVQRTNFGKAWQDEAGMIWSDRIGRANHYYAIENCKAIHGKLPSRDDFIRAEANGIREVMPNMKDHWFWCSSVHPNVSAFAYFFGYDGNDGNSDDVSHGTLGNLRSVRCVASR